MGAIGWKVIAPFFMEENKSESPDGQEASGSEPNKQQNSSLEELQKRIAYMESETKKAFKDRDTERMEKRELADQIKAIKDAEEIEKGNIKKLLDDRDNEIAQTKAETERLRQIEEKFVSLEKAQRDELLAELSEEHKAIAGDLELDKLREYVKLNKATTNSMDSARTGGSGAIDVTGKKWFDFTSTDLNNLKKSNPKLYEQLKKTI